MQLNLVGGEGEKPRVERKAPWGFVYDPTPAEVAEMSDDTLREVYAAMVEYDASGGRVTRQLRREIKRREP
jgi:hypothetical protein